VVCCLSVWVIGGGGVSAPPGMVLVSFWFTRRRWCWWRWWKFLFLVHADKFEMEVGCDGCDIWVGYGGGGCDEFEMEVMWWGFPWYLTLWPIFKSVEICRILFESLKASKSVEICRGIVFWLNSTASVLMVGSFPTGVHQLLTHGAAFWILMGRTLLIRVRKLVFSGVSTGWVDVSLVITGLFYLMFCRGGLRWYFMYFMLG
jgi:hypothetical protein